MSENNIREECNKLFREYQKRFGKGLPAFMVRYSDEEWCKVIRKCLEENKPFELPKHYEELMKTPGLFF